MKILVKFPLWEFGKAELFERLCYIVVFSLILQYIFLSFTIILLFVVVECFCLEVPQHSSMMT